MKSEYQQFTLLSVLQCRSYLETLKTVCQWFTIVKVSNLAGKQRGPSHAGALFFFKIGLFTRISLRGKSLRQQLGANPKASNHQGRPRTTLLSTGYNAGALHQLFARFYIRPSDGL
jgi:hypothetical protein